MAGKKEHLLPQSTWHLIREVKAAFDEERRCEREFIEHLNSTYLLRAEEGC